MECHTGFVAVAQMRISYNFAPRHESIINMFRYLEMLGFPEPEKSAILGVKVSLENKPYPKIQLVFFGG